MALALLVTALDAVLIGAALGGVAPLRAHAPALALLATWAVGGIVLALRRPVHSQDVVERAPESPAVLVVLALLPLATAPLAALGERLGLWLLPGGDTLRWLGVALSGFGLAVRIAAMSQLGPRFSPLLAVQRDHDLETSGLYGRIRHPGYLGAWLVSLGGALAFGGGLGLPLVALMGLLLHNRAVREEALLAQRFGDVFQRYRARTGRFLPRLMPGPPA